MIVPWWYLSIWAASAIAYACLSVLVFCRARKQWPSLCSIGLDKAAFFVAGQLTRHNYPLYFRLYWWESLLMAILYVWLAWDIWRAIPAVRWFPTGVKASVWIAGALTGVVFAWLTVPQQALPLVTVVTRCNRSAQYSFGVSAAAMLLVISINGIGFARTGFAIMAGAIARQLAAIVTSSIIAHPSILLSYLQAKPSPRMIVRITNTADTTITLLVALYWLHAIWRAPSVEEHRRAAWNRTRDLMGAFPDAQ